MVEPMKMNRFIHNAEYKNTKDCLAGAACVSSTPVKADVSECFGLECVCLCSPL